MIDFHSHILPNMDDGPKDVAFSLAMLRQSFHQGVDAVVSTSHFYANEEYPEDFLRRRAEAYEILQDAMLMSTDVYPKIFLGAEVLYFPGISQAEEVQSLFLGTSRTILVEPPMTPWSDIMLDDIAQMGVNYNCIPVIAHVDRYMQILHDETLMDRVLARGMRVQVNGAYFLNPDTRKKAIKRLRAGQIHVIGSDCHNLDSRAPNLGPAWKQAKDCGADAAFRQLRQNAVELLLWKGEKSEKNPGNPIVCDSAGGPDDGRHAADQTGRRNSHRKRGNLPKCGSKIQVPDLSGYRVPHEAPSADHSAHRH